MAHSDTSRSNVAATKSKYLIMLIVLAGTFMSVLDGVVVNIALPTITGRFGVRLSDSQWIVTAYLLTLTGLLLVFGKVSEYTGKSRLFTYGFAVFSAGSLACGLSGSLTQLISFRVIQAAGAAMVFSISGAILFQAFPPHERGRAMGYLGSTVAIGSIAGPILGGLLVDALGWEYIFFINVPIGVLVIAGALHYLKLPEERSARLTLDWPGAALLILFMSALMLFLGRLAVSAAPVAPLLIPGLLFVAAFIGFILRERRCRDPLLDLSVFRLPRFSLPILSMVLYFTANFTIGLVGPFYFEGVMGFRPSQVGMIFMVIPVIMAVASPICGWLYDKHYSRYYAAGGLTIMTAAYLLYGTLAPYAQMPGIIAALILTGLGGALFQSPNNTEIMSALPREKTAVASSLMATMRNLGMSLGVSLASILLSLQLHGAGHRGEVLAAGRALLAMVIGRTMYAAAAVIFAGALISFFSVRWRGRD